METTLFWAGCTAYTPGGWARNVIYLDARLNHNQIYAEDVDFDEVFTFIAERCVNAKGRGRRKQGRKNAQ